MHEHSFIGAIVRDIENKDKIKKIVLEVGELAGIEAGHLKEHMEEVFDWDIEVLGRGSLVKCGCGFEGRARILERLHDLVVFECAVCGGVPEVLEGNNIKILSIQYS